MISRSWSARFPSDGLASAARAAGVVRTWWVKEFLALLPKSAAARLTGERAGRLLFSADGDDARISLYAQEAETVVRPLPGSYAPSALDDFLAAQGIARKDVLVGLEFEPGECFFRSFDIPAAAEKTLDRLALVEIERKTPFRLDEIFHGLSVEALDGKLRVHQVVIKRAMVEKALTRIGADRSDFQILVARQETGRIFEISLAPKGGAVKPSAPVARWLGLCVAVLFVLAFGLIVWRQQSKISTLEADISRTKTHAMVLRAKADELVREQNLLARIRLKKVETISFVDIWEEATRLLPNDSWLVELRLSEGKSGRRLIFLSGYSKSAAGLVGLIERSPLFAGAALTAAITPDAALDRERFALQARVRRKPVSETKH